MKRLLKLLNCIVGLCIAPHAIALSVICECEYAGKVETITTHPTSDVFEYKYINLRNRFRFQIQLLSESSKLKTYVYEFQNNLPVILYAGEQTISPEKCSDESKNLGENKVYSSNLGREMYFNCRLNCD